MDRRSCSLVPKCRFRTIAKYAKPPYNEIVLNVPPAMLGPVALTAVVDSALLRSIFRPFKPAFLYTSCTQSPPARNVPHYFWVARDSGTIARLSGVGALVGSRLKAHLDGRVYTGGASRLMRHLIRLNRSASPGSSQRVLRQHRK